MNEIPDGIVSLYRHWDYYAEPPKGSGASISVLDTTLIENIEDFVEERMRIWHRKEVERAAAPFTQDQILAKYRFCNIYRELDRQTREIHTLLNPLRNDLKLWLLNIVFARVLCNTSTFQKVGVLGFEAKSNMQVMDRLIALPSPKWGTAYIFPISTLMKSTYPTREEWLCKYVPLVAEKLADELMTFRRVSVIESLNRLLPILGYPLKFHMTEVLIDVAYQFPELIDLRKEFFIGPGARPTLVRLSPHQDPSHTLSALQEIELKSSAYLTLHGRPLIFTAENWEGIACEFRKYSNLKSGHGRRRIYR